MSMTGGQSSSPSLQPGNSGRSGFSLPRDGVQSEEVIFEVKVDQGLPGNNIRHDHL